MVLHRDHVTKWTPAPRGECWMAIDQKQTRPENIQSRWTATTDRAGARTVKPIHHQGWWRRHYDGSSTRVGILAPSAGRLSLTDQSVDLVTRRSARRIEQEGFRTLPDKLTRGSIDRLRGQYLSPPLKPSDRLHRIGGEYLTYSIAQGHGVADGITASPAGTMYGSESQVLAAAMVVTNGKAENKTPY